jgi:hypothetical protein
MHWHVLLGIFAIMVASFCGCTLSSLCKGGLRRPVRPR